MLSTLTLAGVLALAPAHEFALHSGRIHLGDGSVLEDATVHVASGKIVAVGTDLDLADGIPVIECEGELSPGLIGLRDSSGAGAEAQDNTRVVMAEAELRFAFNPDHSQVHRLVENGVTSVVFAPRSGSNLIGGIAAVVKPSGRILVPRALLHIDVSASGAAKGRYPTSTAGQYQELERLFSAPEGSIEELVQGRMGVLLEAETRHEVQLALDFAMRHHLRGYLVHAKRAGDLAAAVKASGLGVALGPFLPGEDPRHLASAVALAEAGVPLGFAVDGSRPLPSALRWSAAACVRAGMKRAAALRALTGGAAELAGIADRVGMIRPGLDADLCLWSGAPTDPSSRLLAVYIDGENVYQAPVKETVEEDEE